MALFYPAYFGSIKQYSSILKSEDYSFEVWDNFEKQTYRNRMYILGPNGKQMLGVPVLRSGKMLTREVAIDYKEDWVGLHQKSMDTAYMSSPFYEYYRDELFDVLNQKFKFLQDLQMASHEFIMQALDEKKAYTSTKAFSTDNNQSDFRGLIQAKKENNDGMLSYVQVFSNRFGFEPNLSVLDLIFNEGPSAPRYLYGL
ncbi:WbqC family protein [Flavobacteriaceae bacterium]|nr:WbqC family protein [Flavobacteriaceae bacterium]